MKNYISILFILFFLSKSILAQDENYVADNYVAPQGLNNWYVEFGGAGLFYSINYEKYLFRNNNENITWLGRVGVGFNPIEGKFLNISSMTQFDTIYEAMEYIRNREIIKYFDED
jgi:hypothetical protein